MALLLSTSMFLLIVPMHELNVKHGLYKGIKLFWGIFLCYVLYVGHDIARSVCIMNVKV